ncbi:MAG TPA: Imm50 family immunity protein [Scandinavium sp.]|jgi:hypothetical protein|uniref:Imm50 family immunity protein n=1 Tax=Scandinavium sp. TaxID=2830653 RepID=UPI002E3482F8|nr:Imm50 family immunity protein [Scandinavium sp.]HEX4501528.1 Imm50 family immunity protein [Scandinavium sp.]
MWFDNAYGKEKIIHLFSSELSITDVELESFLFYAASSLRLTFYTTNIPTNIPKKWKAIKFNSIRLTIEFSDILEFRSNGLSLGFKCSPKITPGKDRTSLHIKNDEFDIYCSARIMEIHDISPFLDSRFEKHCPSLI